MRRKTILLIEVYPNHAEAVTLALQSHGYETHTASNLIQIMEYLRTHEACRLILCGVQHPHVDGFAVLAHVQRSHPGVGVILTGAGEDVSLVRKAFRLGATDVLPGPLPTTGEGVKGLVAAVNHGLQWVERERQTAAYRLHLEQLVSKRAGQLRSLHRDLERWCEVTIATMGELLDLRDEETEGHSKRVTAYTCELAIALELRPAELKTILRGAYLHDIGKIAVPDAILRKPAKLTAEEMAVMRLHCRHGYDIVRKIPALADAAEIVYAHQEAFDGGGYPRGLRGEEIPVGARIFSIADALDAITSDRPYRRASSFATAMEEIARCSGQQFDPEIVERFMALPTETWELLREETTQRRSEGIAARVMRPAAHASA